MPNLRTEIQIKDLRPVEAYLLMNPRRSKLDECFRLIFVDLILRGVLHYREDLRIVSAMSAPAKFHLISKGNHLDQKNLLLYEFLFIKPFSKIPENHSVWMKPYGHELIQNVLGDRHQLLLEVFQSSAIRWLGKPHWSSWFTGWLRLNAEGKQIAASLREQLTKQFSVPNPAHLQSLGSAFTLLSIEKYRPDWFTENVVAQFLKNEYQLDDTPPKTVAKLLCSYQLADYFHAERVSDDSHNYMDDGGLIDWE